MGAIDHGRLRRRLRHAKGVIKSFAVKNNNQAPIKITIKMTELVSCPQQNAIAGWDRDLTAAL